MTKDTTAVGDGENEKPKVKRTYRDSVFRDLFGTKDMLLDLYKTFHRNDEGVTVDDIEKITLENSIVNDLRNDVAFRVKNILMVLFEQQTGASYNIPTRMLMYFAKELMKCSDMAKDNGKDFHRNKRIMIPAPEFYVVYTGDDEKYTGELLLSDSFMKYTDCLELKVRIIREESKDNVLGGYLYFVKCVESAIRDRMRENGTVRKEEMYQAIKEVIEMCIQEGVLADYLKTKKEEVINMYTEEFTTEMLMEVREQEAREEGREEGREEEREGSAVRMLRLKKLSIDEIALYSDLSKEHVLALKRQLGM